MFNGPGKYDDLATLVRAMSNAEGVALIVHGGDRGSSFCVQGNEELILALPQILRTMADQIEAQQRKGRVRP